MATYTELGASIAARAFFFPSLAFNIVRERLQEDWHWSDLITEVRSSPASSVGQTMKRLSALLAGCDRKIDTPPLPVLQHVMLGAIPFQSMLDAEFQQLVSGRYSNCCVLKSTDLDRDSAEVLRPDWADAHEQMCKRSINQR